MDNNEPGRVLNEDLEKKVRKNPISSFNVMAYVKLDQGSGKDYIFDNNKGKLFEYCNENDITVVDPLNSMHGILAIMTGNQIIDLSSNQNYMASIVYGGK